MLKSLITKVVNGLAFLAHSRAHHHAICDIDDENEGASAVPEDVREGHFAVIAMQGEERKRFIVELEYLTDPAFLKLLEKAREEYGFGQKGALSVPCTPQELQKIIENRRVDNATT